MAKTSFAKSFKNDNKSFNVLELNIKSLLVFILVVCYIYFMPLILSSDLLKKEVKTVK